jgi:hypothetical protein
VTEGRRDREKSAPVHPQRREGGREEGADRLALDAEADHARAVVDLLDRVGRHEPPAAGEEARAHREGVRLLGRGAVHRALDASDHPAARVGDEEAGRPAQVEGEGAHVATLFPPCEENPPAAVSDL